MHESWEIDLNRYLAEQSKDDEMNNLVKDMMHQATHDAALFRTYDDDFEVIDRDQVMRCLANLDDAVKNFNIIFDLAWAYCPFEEEKKLDGKRMSIDAIFSALTIMQKNLEKAVKHEAEKALGSKREMSVYGGEE